MVKASPIRVEVGNLESRRRTRAALLGLDDLGIEEIGPGRRDLGEVVADQEVPDALDRLVERARLLDRAEQPAVVLQVREVRALHCLPEIRSAHASVPGHPGRSVLELALEPAEPPAAAPG